MGVLRIGVEMIFFSGFTPLSLNYIINQDDTIVISDSDNDSLNSHMDKEQLLKLDNYAIRRNREIIDEEIFSPLYQT